MKIVILDAYALNPGDLSWAGFEELGDLDIYPRTAPDQILERCRNAEVVITNKTPMDQHTIHELDKLRYIGVLATGYNVIDVSAARENGVVVTNIPDYGTTSVVQMTFALLLELCNNVWRHSESVHQGKWSTSKDWCYWDYPLTELAGKTMGILGLGTIGQQVAKVALAFGMQVIATSGTSKNRKGVKWVSVEALFEQSDVISIHCPLTPNTEGLVNESKLRSMKYSAFIINTARGPIINEKDLAKALNTRIIAGVAVDVLSTEPPSADNPLFNAKNCIITPHIAWATKESRKRLMDIAVQNLLCFMDGNKTNVVN
jgi:glycerate dehydrogenase